MSLIQDLTFNLNLSISLSSSGQDVHREHVRWPHPQHREPGLLHLLDVHDLRAPRVPGGRVGHLRPQHHRQEVVSLPLSGARRNRHDHHGTMLT